MALIALLLGSHSVTETDDSTQIINRYPRYNKNTGLSCLNERCVSNQETEKRYIKPEFNITSLNPLSLSCRYCEKEIFPPYIASTQWHEGVIKDKKYHSSKSHLLQKIKMENLLIFNSADVAEDHGFKPSSYSREEHDKY
jgi:hypothetical protein